MADFLQILIYVHVILQVVVMIKWGFLVEIDESLKCAFLLYKAYFEIEQHLKLEFLVTFVRLIYLKFLNVHVYFCI